ncbi:MAG: hypothetical protein RJA09_2469 [Pseudomonadota bacterium]|jgi:hypothetical protein
MNRCHRWGAWAGLFAACALATPTLWAQVATDQATRAFPDNARRGILKITTPPYALIDGQAAQLSPGSRIRDMNNRIILSAQLVGRELRVNYTREASGLLHDIWILTDAEGAQKRAGNNDFVIRNYKFASEE